MPTFSAGSASVNIVPDFSNAQRMISNWFRGQKDIEVDVNPNLNQASYTRVQSQLAAMPNHEIKVNIDHKHFANQLVKLTDTMVGFTAVQDIFTKLFGPKSVLMVSGVGALTAVAGAAAQAGGALALLPAGIASLAIPIATVTVGLQGMGEAFKAIGTGDIEKINAAMQNLAPAARQFVTEVHSLAPAFKDLRLDIQQELFRGLGEDVRALGENWIPMLTDHLPPLAAGLRNVFQQFLGVLNLQENIQATATVIDNITASTGAWGRTTAALTQIWIDLSVVGSDFLPGMSNGLADVVQKMADWVAKARESGVLHDIIQQAIDVLQVLGQIVMNVGSILVSVFKAGAESGGTILQILRDVTGQLAAFLNTDVAQSGLTTFFTLIAETVKALMPGFMALTQAVVTGLLPAMAGLAAAVAPVANTILVQLADMISKLAPLFYPALAEAISAILGAFAPLIPVITEIAQVLFPILSQILIALAPVVTQVAEAFGEALTMALHALEPLLPLIVDAIQAMLNAVTPLIPVILELVEAALPPLVELLRAVIPVVVQIVEAVMPAFIAVVKALTPVIQLLGDIINWAFSEILGPAITWTVNNIVVPLLNLAAVTFSALATGIKWAFDNIIKPTWDAMQAAISWLWDNILKPIFAAIGAAWEALWIAAKWVWDNVLKPVWDAIAAAAQWLWENVIRPIWDSMKLAWQILLDAFKAYWDNVLHPMWIAVETAARWLWENVLQPIWDAMKVGWNALLDAFKWAWDNILHPVWVAIETAANWLWNNVLKPIWDAMKAVWEGLVNGMRWVYDHVLHPVWQVLTDAVNGVKRAFDVVVEGIKTAWNALKNIVAAPINFVIEYVFNKGLFAAWNWLVDTLHLPFGHAHFDQITGEGISNFAYGGPVTDAQDVTDGGRVRGKDRGPRADNVLARLTPDEYVIQQPVARRIRPFLDALNSGQAEAVQAAGGWFADPTGLRAYAAGGNVQRALDIARSLQGKPYIWGGAGPNGSDCSGFQSIITRALRGEANVFSRVGTTATFPWPGFVNGFGTPYTIGSVKNAFFSGIGHMAGTLDSHPVESGSGHGPMVDGSALGANASLFNVHGWLNTLAGATASSSAGIDHPWYVDLWHTVQGAKDWLMDHILGPIGDMAGKFGDFPLTKVLTGIPKTLAGWVWDAVRGAIEALFAAATSDDSNTPGDVGGLKQQAYATAQAMYGWGSAADRAGIDFIVGHESGWNPKAQNPTSTASGLWQHIRSTWLANRPIEASSYANMKDAPTGHQDKAGIRYIHDKFGTIPKAQAFWQSHNYYDRGGWIPPGLSSVWNATGRPEPVLTAAEHDSLLRWRGMTGNGFARGLGERLMGDVHIHGGGRQAGEIMDELWHRLRVARRGGVYATSSVYTAG